MSQSTLHSKSCTLRHGIKPWLLYQSISLPATEKIFLVEGNGTAIPCPKCGGGLKHRDSRKRIHKREGGEKDIFIISRCKCTRCGKLHAVLPDCLMPYKHYDTEVICGVLDEIVTPDDVDSEDYPCAETMKRWRLWFKKNSSRAEGYLRNALYRLLDNKDDFLYSGMSLLSYFKETEVIPHWLGYILRVIYNTGGFLVPVW